MRGYRARRAAWQAEALARARLRAVAVDGKTCRGARRADSTRVHLPGAAGHGGHLLDHLEVGVKHNETSHFTELLEPLELVGAVVTFDAMQANRDNSLFLRKAKNAHWLWPVLGNQPSLNETLNVLDWENTPAAAATSEITRGRIETRTIRVLPAPEGTGFCDAARALLIERYVTYKKKGRWHTRAEAVL